MVDFAEDGIACTLGEKAHETYLALLEAFIMKFVVCNDSEIFSVQNVRSIVMSTAAVDSAILPLGSITTTRLQDRR